jgi:ankyrin repeat protein
MPNRFPYIPAPFDFNKEFKEAKQANSTLEARLRFLAMRAIPTDLNLLRQLIEAGLDPNCEVLFYNPLRKKPELIPLLTACVVQIYLRLHERPAEHIDTSMISWLLENGASLTHQRESTLHMASALGLVDVMRPLLRKADVAQPALAHRGKTSLIGETALHWAARFGKAETAVLLLQTKADVNAKAESGITPLHLAAWGWHFATIRVLLKHGANIKEKDGRGDTPLDVACEKGKARIAQLMIEESFDPDHTPEEKYAEAYDMVKESNKGAVSALFDTYCRTIRPRPVTENGSAVPAAPARYHTML